jgi:DNA-binding CsgD family transcriptional regulator
MHSDSPWPHERDPLRIPSVPLPAERDKPESLPCVEALVSAMPVPILVLDGQARLRARSAKAGALISTDGVLRLDGDRVRPRSEASVAQWAECLAAAGRGRYASIRLKGAVRGVAINVLPLGDEGWVAAVEALPPTRNVQVMDAAHRFRLTPAEIEVLQSLVEGHDVAAIRRLRGTSEATLRTQTRSLLAKAGARNLRHLVCIVLGSAAPCWD